MKSSSTAGWLERCGIGDEAAYDLTSQLLVLSDLEFTAIEVRTVGGRGLHELDRAEVVDVAAQIGECGLKVPVVDTPIGNWDTTIAADLRAELTLLESYASSARALGCDRLRVMSWPSDGRPAAVWAEAAIDRMTRLAREAERLGVTLLHENCAGWGGLGHQETLRLLEAVDSPALRLLMDLGNGLVHGYDARTFLAAVLPWVEHVHVKDGRTTSEGAVFTVPGEGDVGLAGCLQLLADDAYTGWYSLEPHVAHIPHLGQSADTAALAAGFAACVDGFRTVWQEVRHSVSP